ncbi:hypothetical protein EJ04DRAFT_553853 [Polyplosphaeria fusca]|uniref:Uncharacterized protein n=1 Tax=Polyplosphaeria fusca TaxID=682080 RepID=A0A9P4QWV5_9PLEO|nr:hypothetical protein EJ04DRAFT_553853 [Polyplosphaeria fusca]
MLERASICLESGGRKLVQARTQYLRSSRILHSSFWHHGVADLSTQASLVSVLLSDRGGDVDDSTPITTPRTGTGSHDGLLLGFLYPEKTLALLRRISKYSWDTIERRRVQPANAGSIRHFSTTRTHWPRNKEIELEDDLRTELHERLRGSTAADALAELVDSDELGQGELAWQLYARVDERDRTSKLRCDVLQYLDLPGNSTQATRTLRIFNSLPVEDRTVLAHRVGISAYLILDMIGNAVNIHEEAAQRHGYSDFGTNILLGRAVQDYQWDIALRVFRNFWQHSPFTDAASSVWSRPKAEFRHIVWEGTENVADLHDKLNSFLQHVRQFQHELRTPEDKTSLELFLQGFIPATIKQVLAAKNPKEDFIWKFFIALFEELQPLSLPRLRKRAYDYALSALYNVPRYQVYTNQPRILSRLYNQYREEAYHSPYRDLRPLRRTIELLMHLNARHGSVDVVQALERDMRRFHSSKAVNLRFLMHFYADYGLVEKVIELFNELCGREPDTITLKDLSALLFVHARRIDVAGTLRQFRRISDEFGLTPNTTCWNMVLLAHARADDLEGAFGFFNEIEASGVPLDQYTFGTLLDLCASRGDLEAFEALYSKADQLSIGLRNMTATRSGYVEACLNAGDAEGAEAVAHRMLEDSRKGTLHGSLTHTWNLLITHHALNRDLESSRRLYRQMVNYGIPLDSWTYAALMRSLIEVGQTNAAYRIMRTTMRNNNIRVYAFHYAIVMTGFLSEGQYEHALKVHERMKERNPTQTPSSRLASLEVVGRNELRRISEASKGARVHLYRLTEVEETLRQMLFDSFESQQALRQPRHKYQIDSRSHSVPQDYFGLLILLYSTKGAYEVCKELLKAASAATPDDENYAYSIGLLTAIMEAHLRAGEYDEVAKCWHLAKAQAEKLVKTAEAVQNPGPPALGFDSIIDPEVRNAFASAKIATNRRQVLARAARIYIRSLLNQSDNASLQEAQRTFRELITSGFALDDITWNEFIQMLAQRGRVIDAFTACETYLMPHFPGWRFTSPIYARKDRRGYLWQDVRHYDITKKTVMPRYKTLVVLAAAYKQIRRDQSNGVGWKPEMGGWVGEILEQLAPLTTRAIDTMPVKDDRVQNRFLGMV